MIYYIQCLLLFIVIYALPYKVKSAGLQKQVIVPHVVHFADLRLELAPMARKRVQAKVNNLTIFNKSFDRLLERMNLVFPLIEKVLAEESVPDDFKYQALHESMLIGNALSHTNDLGYWQIQKITALSLRLKIDDAVDERMHLIKSTRAAAHFLKDNYRYFNSWLGAMLAYNRGRGGAARIFPKKYHGIKKIRLDHTTDPYILYVLANKIAFEQVAGKKQHPTLRLCLYNEGYHGHKLQDIANHLKIEEKLLREHNCWLRVASIPHNVSCPLVVPFLHTHAHFHRSSVLKMPIKLQRILPLSKKTGIVAKKKQQLPQHSINYEKYLKNNPRFPLLTPCNDPRSARLIKANGKLAVVAKKGDKLAQLAKLANCTVEKFLLINEIKKEKELMAGSVYYFSQKESKAMVHYHVVESGDTLWRIAQKYGIRLSALLEKNRMSKTMAIEPRQILWLRFIRPQTIPIAYKPLDT
ncbi:MAG: LysM peptidoglycan-binding domain-containing protein [Amoebophilaceae bacterium]|nr:LysM peptidoglycan-binding domain-containing protein [Amoebophilaceae bacterium]